MPLWSEPKVLLNHEVHPHDEDVLALEQLLFRELVP
jgi:hypothetical protein